MNRIAANHPDSGHPDHGDFQIGDAFHDAADAAARLAAAEDEFPGYDVRHEQLVNNGDDTSTWTEV